MTDWTGVNGEYPDNPEFLPRETVFETEPLPNGAFRQNDMENFGYPYLVIFPEWEHITFKPVKQHDYICVYDMLAEKADFLTNGNAILSPTAAPIHEIINGEYSLTLTHPMDSLGKWKYIRESNLIKCQGQVYTIKRVEWNHTSENTGTVTAYCEHAFYQLADMWDFADRFDDHPTFAYCKSAIDSIMRAAVTNDEGTMYRFDYSWDSDWTWGGSNGHTIYVNGNGCTPVELLLGSGGIIDAKGGELYRDNFYFSINERMENAVDDAFDLRFGANMKGLKRTVDTSTLATWLLLQDEQTGALGAVSYAGYSFPLFQFPHVIARSQTIRYDDKFYEDVANGDADIFERLFTDLFCIWKSTCTPVICYEVDVKDLADVYPELKNHYQYKVGNSGRIYDELLGGAITLKITETEVDGITGEVTRVVFGSKNSFTRGAGYPLEFTGEPTESTYEFPMRDSRGKLMYDSRGKQMMRRGSV